MLMYASKNVQVAPILSISLRYHKSPCNPSISIIFCCKADKKFAEYVLHDYSRPMGVATFKTSADMDENLKKVLPSIEDLTKLLDKK